MAKRNWTKDQLNAINARGGTILVSAAAGSGKTAVLVERVTQRIIDRENPCNVDKILMVTFTRAAAAEMRERISETLTSLLEQNPNDSHIRRQLMLLPQAKICTIDSFCNDLVRENFHRLGISPDYKISENSEQEILQGEAVNEVLEELYGEGSPAFEELLDLFMKGRSDEQLGDAIRQIYRFTGAYPFPEEWLDNARSLYSAESDKSELWMRIILQYVCSSCAYAKRILDDAITILDTAPPLSEKYSPSILSGLHGVEKIYDLASSEDWDGAMNAVKAFKFTALGRVPKEYSGSFEQNAVKSRRDTVSKLVKKLDDVFCATSEENKEDLEALQPVAQKLFDAVERFGDIYNEKKAERNTLEFSDIEHLALKLLIEKDKYGNICRTDLAKEVSNSYVEILLDEYQDTNEAQDTLFWAISKNENNLFMVGDVKQSIYRFRQAMPEIFLAKRKGMLLYDGETYPACINLDRNFRSRAGVAGMVNFVFRQLMSEQLGEMEYTVQEELVPAAQYSPSPTPDVELHLVTGDDETEMSVLEARHVAATIRRLIDEGTLVEAGGIQRPLEYRDICILLRSTKGIADKYVEELVGNGIPAWTETKGGFFGVTEIRVMLSLLRILDNPIQDVALLSVMMSPIYGFTPDDESLIRMKDRKLPLYSCVVKAAEDGDEHCREFIESISSLRRLSATLPSDELIRRIYEETSYPAIVGVMNDSGRRRANLRLLLNYAANYESAGYKGLSGLIHYIDRLEQRRADLATASDLSEAANVVRVMSIHKSKGLEFPVCIIGNCSKKFNDMSRRGDMILQSGIGVGLKRRDAETMRRFATLPHTAAKLALEREELSEELRVLYVGMTRTREKLILIVNEKKDFEKRLTKLSSGITEETKVDPFFVRTCGSYGDWILTAALRHPDAKILRDMAGADDIKPLESDFTLRIEQNTDDESILYNNSIENEVCDNTDFLHELSERLRYKYPYEELSSIVSKRAASDAPEEEIDENYFASSRPSFMEEGGLTAAQKGTALHKFLQFSDYKSASENPRVELERLVSKGFLSEQEGKAVNLSRISDFFASDLGKQILNAEKIWREYKFAKLVPASRYAPEIEKAEDEEVLVQGIADCIFEHDGKLVIVDYKTDRVSSAEQLVSRYNHQMEVYREALSECLGMEVEKTVLYSFHLQTAVEVIF